MVERATSLHGGVIWRTHDSRAELSREVTALLEAAIVEAIAERGGACLALAGGITPMPIYERLAQADLDWTKVLACPTDERCAPADHPARNDLMLKRAFARGPAREATIIALDDYQRVATLPSFDAVLLGMGADGHFASIFPRSEGAREATDLDRGEPTAKVVPDPLPAEAPFVRLTLTLARLINARRVALLITGADKLRMAQDACAPGDPLDPPIRALFAAAHVEVHWSA